MREHIREQHAGLFSQGQYTGISTRKQHLLREYEVSALPASRPAVGTNAGIHSEDKPFTTGKVRQQGAMPLTFQKPSPPDDSNEDDGFYESRPASSAIRLRSQVPARETEQQSPIKRRRSLTTTPVPPPRRSRWRWHPLVSLGVGMVLMAGLVIFATAGLSWWQRTQDDWRYGYPRTYQVDAVVGHHDSLEHPSHFLVVNLHAGVDIVELQGGDPAKAVIYQVTHLVEQGGDLLPITISFQDTHHNGEPEMDVHIAGSTVVLPNDGNRFVVPHP